MNTTLIVLAVGGAALTIVVAGFVRKLSRKLDRRLVVTALAGLGLGVLAWLYLAYGALAAAGGVLAAGGLVAGWVVWRRGGTAHMVTRWGERARRRSGVATPLQVARVASTWAMHRKAAAVRPHLREVSRRERWRVPTRELGVMLCRTAGIRVWASVEDVVLLFGGPRTGKTAWLGGAIIDAPGAVVTTSTRTDLLDLTRRLRETDGRPVRVYNPGGLGDLPSTISFEPVYGCENPTTAIERAADMIPEKDDVRGEAAQWDAQSRRVFAALLHAAGLSGGTRDSHDILRWVSNPEQSADEVQMLLRRSPVPSFSPDIEQFVTLNPTTRSSITTGIIPALQWLNSQSAVAATKGGDPFDVAELLHKRGTVYMLGRHEAHTAPLLAALTGYIAREARRLAALQPGGRLDPPLGLFLDEAARVAPVPLPDWSGDAGGSGIQLVCAFQSRADLLDRWGTNGTAKAVNNAARIMLFGGTKDAADLDFWSKLAGPRDEPVKTRNGDGRVTSTSPRKTQVLEPAQLSHLPQRRVVVFSNGMPPVIGRAPRVWERRDVRALARASRKAPAHPVGQVAPTHPSPAPGASPALPGAVVSHPSTRELTNVSH